MPIQRQSLTTYHMREFIDGEQLTDFDRFLRDTTSVQSIDWGEDGDFTARLYIAISNPKRPAWIDFLEDGFGDLDVPEAQRIDALLAVRVSYYRRDHFFAFTFGHGRHLLKPGSYDRSYGLRVALNIIYDSEDQAPVADRLRSVDSTTVATNTIRTRRQVDRRADFETFGVDIQRDLLKAVTGMPVASSTWGTRISGSDSFNANPMVNFSKLGKYCKNLERVHRRDTYKQDFEWIDNLAVVTDPGLLAFLYDELVERIQAGESYSVSVPELVEWDEIDKFSFSFFPEGSFADPEEADLFVRLREAGKSDSLSVESLKKRWRLEAFDSSSERLYSWPVLKCLSAELVRQDGTFILSEGEFFRVRRAFLEDLDGFIGSLALTGQVLPASDGDVLEGDYNKKAANGKDSYLLLDKCTVRVGGITSPIEVCDILSSDGTFIHVKRKLGSSSLSHLFAQGTVSADLFLLSREYREVTLSKIRAQEVERAKLTGDEGFIGRFSTFDVEGIRSADYSVAYGIVAKWRKRKLEEALPFFSKVNLRRHVVDLVRMGYRVEMAMIDVE